MPNRIIREGIIDSPRVESLVRDAGWPAEVFYRRLQQIVDDFGRFDGRLSMLKARCYPTVIDLVRDAELERWIAACVKARLLRIYEVSGNRYLELLDFRQQMRAKTSKWPEPLAACAADATHVQASAHCIREAETEALFGGEGVVESCVEPSNGSPLDDSLGTPVLSYPCVKGTNGKTEWHLTKAKLAEYVEAFPGLDVMAGCRAALQWCRDNSSKRKTFQGMPKFLGGWLTRQQNSGKAQKETNPRLDRFGELRPGHKPKIIDSVEEYEDFMAGRGGAL